jgi:hypothetical protein
MNGGCSTKIAHETPAVTSEPVFETLAAGCTYVVAADDAACDPDLDPSFAEMFGS